MSKSTWLLSYIAVTFQSLPKEPGVPACNGLWGGRAKEPLVTKREGYPWGIRAKHHSPLKRQAVCPAVHSDPYFHTFQTIWLSLENWAWAKEKEGQKDKIGCHKNKRLSRKLTYINAYRTRTFWGTFLKPSQSLQLNSIWIHWSLQWGSHHPLPIRPSPAIVATAKSRLSVPDFGENLKASRAQGAERTRQFQSSPWDFPVQLSL